MAPQCFCWLKSCLCPFPCSSKLPVFLTLFYVPCFGLQNPLSCQNSCLTDSDTLNGIVIQILFSSCNAPLPCTPHFSSSAKVLANSTLFTLLAICTAVLNGIRARVILLHAVTALGWPFFTLLKAFLPSPERSSVNCVQHCRPLEPNETRLVNYCFSAVNRNCCCAPYLVKRLPLSSLCLVGVLHF